MTLIEVLVVYIDVHNVHVVYISIELSTQRLHIDLSMLMNIYVQTFTHRKSVHIKAIMGMHNICGRLHGENSIYLCSMLLIHSLLNK